MKTINDLQGLNYFSCVACMSVWADALSWANANNELVTLDIEQADNIIVLSCQVTDLAVLNDFNYARKFKEQYPNKNVFMSGCLAQRDDIELPEGIERLEQMRTNYQRIYNKTLVKWEKPFWIKDYKDSRDGLTAGSLFRHKYPLRIGKGCKFNCEYCTIKKTRGEFEQYDIGGVLEEEFLDYWDTVLIAESPTVEQIKYWYKAAYHYAKPISIRNIEPQVAVACKEELIKIAEDGLLEIFHCPIQHSSREVIEDMKRNYEATYKAINLCQALKNLGTKIATNIIIDYKDYPNNFMAIYDIFDYVSWNPYWDGVWDEDKAKQRWNHYLGGRYVMFL